MLERSQYKKFELVNDGFIYKGDYHPFDEIKHLHLERVQTTQRVNLVKVGQPESSKLIIELKNGDKVKLSFSESTLFVGLNIDKKQDIQNLIELYIDLCKKTFQHRVSYYEHRLKNEGFFIYD
jgi:hypothetical protein